MEKLKKILNKIFIDGLSGMATGLFATLIIGTIISQIGSFIPGNIGTYIYMMGKVASSVTGAGIGVGVALKYKESPLVVISAATAGMMGAFASKILAGAVLVDGVITYAGPGEPLGAFIAALVAILIGHLVLMGIILTLPISSAALGIILNLSGLAAGAATVGCCANMVGFAVASYKDNKVNGLLAQGLGTSMLQIGNIVKKPIIWLPAILTSAVLGPVSTLVFGMTNNATGSGMGTAGLVGQITTYQTMGAMESGNIVLVKIIVLHFLLTGVLSWAFATGMRKLGWLQDGDMKLDV